MNQDNQKPVTETEMVCKVPRSVQVKHLKETGWGTEAANQVVNGRKDRAKGIAKKNEPRQ